MNTSRPLVVIGGGPAGMGAAIEAARAGLSSTVIDEAPALGGQIYRQPPKDFRVKDTAALGKDFADGERLRAEFNSVSDQVEYLPATSVLGVWPNKHVLWASDTTSGIIEADQIVVATGAYERAVPFPGWTLPGVMTAGGVQTLIKTLRVSPGRRALVAGAGPLTLSVARRLREIGVEVVAVLDASEPWLETLCRESGDSGLHRSILENHEYLRHCGIRVFHNHTIFSAIGKNEVEKASFGPVDPADWRPQWAQEQTTAVDLVCLGFGFIPNSELTQLARCDHRYVHELGGWVPVRAATMRTSVPGVFAVGDGAGITGALASLEEGRIAGITAAESAGFISRAEADLRRAGPFARLASIKAAFSTLGKLTRIRPGVLELMRPETLVCRCEEVSLAEVTAALDEGAGDLQALKLRTRLGMGACQGRNCAPSMGMKMCQVTGRKPEQIGRINPRPPIKPVTFGTLAQMKGIDEVPANDSLDAINTGGSP